MAKSHSAPLRLGKISTLPPKGFSKPEIKEKTAAILQTLSELQNRLYAESKYSLLIVLQGMDASGKDGTIRNVFGTLNPQGVQVSSFKVPTPLEASHDFLWRIHLQAPAKGMIRIFNRSHYEDVLVTRVHKLIDDKTVAERYTAINNFENLLTTANNTRILKFYLHISHEEQIKRLNERIHDKTKQWKYSDNDFKESHLWNIYRKVYEDAFNACNIIPWHIVPADKNWYKEYIIASKVLETLQGLDMQYPGIKKE